MRGDLFGRRRDEAHVRVLGLVERRRHANHDASASPRTLGSEDTVVVCAATPLNKTKDPDGELIMSGLGLVERRGHAHHHRVLGIPRSSAKPTRWWCACPRRSTRPKTRTCASSCPGLGLVERRGHAHHHRVASQRTLGSEDAVVVCVPTLNNQRPDMRFIMSGSLVLLSGVGTHTTTASARRGPWDPRTRWWCACPRRSTTKDRT